MTAQRQGITAAGNWIIDHVKLIDHWPDEETLANILDEKQGTGGAPYNCLVDLARFGVDYPLQGIGVIGQDADGAFIRADCERWRIVAAGLRVTTDRPTAYTDVMTVRSTGRRTFFHNRGASAFLDPDDLAPDRVQGRILHLGYLLLLDRLDERDPEHGTVAAGALRRLREAGIRTSVDVVSEFSDRFVAIVPPALRHVDYVILNEFEAGRSSGRPVRRGDGSVDPGQLRAAAAALLDMGSASLVVIHMPEGGYALSRDEGERFAPSLELPADYIKGTAGAGDAFCSGILHGLHEGWTLERCLDLANCAAAANLSDPTCTGGMRALAEVLELGRNYPRRRPIL